MINLYVMQVDRDKRELKIAVAGSRKEIHRHKAKKALTSLVQGP